MTRITHRYFPYYILKEFLSNIVQSIQAEQNAIIRKKPYYSVIINGIAGSGKTSIAMHRISYILYALKGTITSRNIRIISPNPMFSEYISKLLPELGEENVESESRLSFMRTFEAIPIKMDASRKEMVEACFADPFFHLRRFSAPLSVRPPARWIRSALRSRPAA